MITVGVIGSTGYAGAELMRLLCRHPHVEKILAASHSYVGDPFSQIYPNFNKIFDAPCQASDMATLAKQCDLLFLSLPHGISSQHVTEAMVEECLIIDLGADFRFSDVSVYETWYKTNHKNHHLLAKAVYGLCELNRQQIKTSRLIANPGCYTTCSILTTYPLLAKDLIDADTVVIDAKSGVSGAGRGEKLGSMFCESNESIKPYGVTTHRHTPEIEEQLSLAQSHGTQNSGVIISFTPHLVPMNRGILATVYAKLRPGVTQTDVEDAYATSYKNEQFVRVLPYGNFPETRWVKGSNYCDIGFTIDQRTQRIVACGALDNLVKGAAGQAVQNMNILFGFEEATGLDAISAFPL
ncbi:MAG: N-acetyl-gamma-glutamyl-phosphate reductase [Sphaerochaetaceae bacterium]|jgi:N-acetyl-gamma-glutamyl-phosphate reductase|nr:N-acetyl-gamma-glutamyl-phosphate reductase [Sphaerochaetaceae bacterium]MDY0370895.1 N-acetyl-gamma-glutamyl-phosphate reductase [Sphaerochaetaceae bacterium]